MKSEHKYVCKTVFVIYSFGREVRRFLWKAGTALKQQRVKWYVLSITQPVVRQAERIYG